MIGIIARREVTDAWREGRVRVAAGLLSVILLLALAIGAQHWLQTRSTIAANTAEDRRVWQLQGPVNPHSASHFGRYIFKPVGPLAFIDEGINPYTGAVVYLEAHTRTPARMRPAEDAAFMPVFGELTVALVLQTLVPLLIILVAFSAFSGERESGTFRQLVSLGVSRQKLVLGKSLGLTAALGIVLLPLVLGGALVVLTAHDAHVATDLLRMGTMALGYLLYFVIFVGATLAVSARAQSSRQALVILLGFWMICTFLVPRLAADAAERLAPVPTTLAFKKILSDEMAKGVTGHDPSDARLVTLKQRLLKQYGVRRIEDLPLNFDGIDLAEGERYGNIVLDRHYGKLWEQYNRQQAVLQGFALLSPLNALRPLSMAMAGTDLARHRDFTEQGEGFRRGFIKRMNDYHTQHGRFDDWEFTADTALWRTVPAFQFVERSFGSVFVAQAGNLIPLLAWAGLAILAAFLAIRHAPVGG